MGLWGWLNQGSHQIDDKDQRLGHGEYMQGLIQQGLGQGGVASRGAPQADRTLVGGISRMQGAQLDPAQQEQWRKQQWQTAQHLNRIASGEQQGAGELAANRAISRGLAGQQALANMARGGNAALAARQAARTGADITGAGAGQAQQAALQDQSMALGQLNQLSGQARGQDIAIAQQNAQMMQQANVQNMSAENQRVFQQAGLDQATSLANMQARLKQTGMNDAMIGMYLSQLFGMDQAELNARLKAEGIEMQSGSNLNTVAGMAGAAGSAFASGGAA